MTAICFIHLCSVVFAVVLPNDWLAFKVVENPLTTIPCCQHDPLTHLRSLPAMPNKSAKLVFVKRNYSPPSLLCVSQHVRLRPCREAP